jgi:hypothetical protein
MLRNEPAFLTLSFLCKACANGERETSMSWVQANHIESVKCSQSLTALFK